MFRKILVAYDGSAGSVRALDAALDLATVAGVELHALAVEERLPRFAATVDEVDEEKEYANRVYEERLAIARGRAAAVGVKLETMLRAGHAARTIIDVATEGTFDLLVLGHSGHSEIWSALLGTTVERVARHAPCAVLIVR